MCKHFNTTPDDPRITEMDPVLRLWFYNNWIADQVDDVELAKNHAYLVASFTNPEAVKRIVSDEGKFGSTDEEFEESTRMVMNGDLSSLGIDLGKPKEVRRRKRKVIRG